MKTITNKFMVLLSFILLTGCFDFDVVHYIEPRKDKTIYIKMRITSMFLKDESSGAAEKVHEFKDNIISTIGLDKTKSFNVAYETNDFQGSIEYSLTAKHSMLTIENTKNMEIPFNPLPIVDRNGQYIFMFHNYQKYTTTYFFVDSRAVAEGMLASSKYRLAFRNVIPKKAAIIVNRQEQEIFNLSIYHLGNIYFIDIPMNLILLNESAIIVSFNNTIQDANIRNYLTKLNKKREEEEKKHLEELEKQQNNDTINPDTNNDTQEDYNDENSQNSTNNNEDYNTEE